MADDSLLWQKIANDLVELLRLEERHWRLDVEPDGFLNDEVCYWAIRDDFVSATYKMVLPDACMTRDRFSAPESAHEFMRQRAMYNVLRAYLPELENELMRSGLFVRVKDLICADGAGETDDDEDAEDAED